MSSIERTVTTQTAVDDAAEVELAREQAAGLRALADMIEQNPHLAEQVRYSFTAVNVPIGRSGDVRATMTDFVRRGVRAGAVVTKEQDDSWAGATLAWGPVGIHVYAARAEVCERVVTGYDTVTETVPDPVALAAVPMVKRTFPVEKVEWVCRPMLDTEAVARG